MEEKDFTPYIFTGPEYFYKEKTLDWFWTVGLIALVGAGIAVWVHNYLFGLFIIISAVALIIVARRAPRDITYKISPEGINVDTVFYEKKKLKGFKIKDGRDGFDKLILEIDRRFMPVIVFPSPSSDKINIKNNLILIVEEKDIEEPRTAQFMERIGF